MAKTRIPTRDELNSAYGYDINNTRDPNDYLWVNGNIMLRDEYYDIEYDDIANEDTNIAAKTSNETSTDDSTTEDCNNGNCAPANSDINNHTSASVSNRMQNLKNTIDKLNIKFNQNRPVYTMYLKFIVNGEVLVDTTSKNWVTNNLVSFSIDQNGSGQANTFTLDILFPPNDRNMQDILAIEKILLNTTHIVRYDGNTNTFNNETLKDRSEYFMDCEFIYGYADDIDLRSPKYTGKVMKYIPSIDNGNLKYTITGYAGLYGAKEIKWSPKQEYLAGMSGSIDPFKYIENVFNTEFKNINSEYYGAYDLVFLDNCFDENGQGPVYDGVDFTQYEQKNLFDLIKDILNGCLSKEEYDLMKSGKKFAFTQKQCYGFYVSTSTTNNTMGTVYIYKTPSVSKTATNVEKQNAVIPDCNIEFSWFAPNKTGLNYLVKSWKPEFDGTIAIAGALSLLTKGDVFETMDKDGNIIKVNGMGATRLGVNDTNITYNSVQEYVQWSFVTQYPYKASMIVQGCPCEVPMTGKIGIHAKICGFKEEHLSSGTYFVMSKKDRLNNSGYFTEFELFKVTPTYDPDPGYSTAVDTKDFNITDGSVSQSGTAIYDKDGKLIGITNYTETTISESQDKDAELDKLPFKAFTSTFETFEDNAVIDNSNAPEP